MSKFDDDLKIEPDALDIEWTRHPMMYMRYAEKSALADDKLKDAKALLDIVDAKIDARVRDLSKDSGGKVTDSLIKSTIIQDPEHQKALKIVDDALHESDLLGAAVKAMEHKKTALENLVRLYVGQYFSGPREPRDLKKELDIYESAIDSSRNKIDANLNKKRRQ